MKVKRFKFGADRLVLIAESDFEDLLDRLCDLEFLNRWHEGEFDSDDVGCVSLEEFTAQMDKKDKAIEVAVS